MKKLWFLLVIAFVMIFSGCARREQDFSDRKIRSSVEDSSVSLEEKEEKNFDENVDEDTDEEEKYKQEKYDSDEKGESVVGSIDESYLNDIGRSVEELENVRGAFSEYYWADGPIYRFGSCQAWYGFEDYEYISNTEFRPKGNCNVVRVPMKDFLKSADYNSDTLEKITGNKFESEFVEMFGTNAFVTEYKNYRFCIYADTKSDINADSVVNVERK